MFKRNLLFNKTSYMTSSWYWCSKFCLNSSAHPCSTIPFSLLPFRPFSLFFHTQLNIHWCLHLDPLSSCSRQKNVKKTFSFLALKEKGQRKKKKPLKPLWDDETVATKLNSLGCSFICIKLSFDNETLCSKK